MTDKNPNYWFKRRRFGWGWTPVSWQGWLSVVISLAVIVGGAVYLMPPKPEQPSTLQFMTFFLITLSVVFILVGISYAKGPVPRWRWGKKPEDNPDEDI